jgi:hypothetical protein
MSFPWMHTLTRGARELHCWMRHFSLDAQLDAYLVELVSSSRVSLAWLIILTSSNLGSARLVFPIELSRVELSPLRAERANEFRVFFQP